MARSSRPLEPIAKVVGQQQEEQNYPYCLNRKCYRNQDAASDRGVTKTFSVIELCWLFLLSQLPQLVQGSIDLRLQMYWVETLVLPLQGEPLCFLEKSCLK